ncbi:hypothetical protein COO60DRAFT_1473122, partial [Scenedesmus sp. NREL 46B-D3]
MPRTLFDARPAAVLFAKVLSAAAAFHAQLRFFVVLLHMCMCPSHQLPRSMACAIQPAWLVLGLLTLNFCTVASL